MKACFLVIAMIAALLGNAGIRSQNTDSLLNDFSRERCSVAFANHHFVDTDIEKPEQNLYGVEIRENARIGDLCIGAAFFIVVVSLVILYSKRKTRMHREEIQRLINETILR